MKRWIATLTTMIVAGLVMMPGTASAHGTTECRVNEFENPAQVWSGARQIGVEEARMQAARAYNVCYFIRAEPRPWSRIDFRYRINNSAAKLWVWTSDGVRHDLTVDHDQTFSNGRWSSAWNRSGRQG